MCAIINMDGVPWICIAGTSDSLYGVMKPEPLTQMSLQVTIGDMLGVVSEYDPVASEFVVLEGRENPPGSAEAVATDASSTRQIVACDEVALVPPEITGEITVLLTDQMGVAAGEVAELVGHDGNDRIVKFLSSGDINILPVEALAKLNSRHAGSQGGQDLGGGGPGGGIAVESAA